ncbi:MAG: hypothetical protein ABIH22_01645 [Candidatus Margulisiibacteriota bacterium]
MNRIIGLLLIALLLTSCSGSKEESNIEPQAESLEVVESRENTVEVDPREPLFVYKNQPVMNLDEIILKLNAEPLLLTSGYVRLVGVVSGGKPLALIEVGGRGLGVEIGDEVGQYQVVNISTNCVFLAKKGV